VKKYYRVRMGRINKFTDPNTYPYPDRKSAVRFATNTASMYPGVAVIVRDPEGRIIKRFGKRALKRKKVAA